jgi:hypothetical protein
MSCSRDVVGGAVGGVGGVGAAGAVSRALVT